MKKIYFLIMALLLLASKSGSAQSDLIITGVADGTLTGGLPKVIEFYVVNDIPDLSVYAFGSANNGGGTDGPEFIFPADAATAGDFLYVASDGGPEFETFFGFAADYESGAAAINGDDAVELFTGTFATPDDAAVVDVFGEQNVDGTGTDWEYADSWAYRLNGTGANTGIGVSFNIAEWNVPGPDVLDNASTNASSANPFPLGTYSPEGDSETEATIQEIQETTNPDGNSPLLGSFVITSGIVTAAYDEGFWIQDGTGAWSGLFVRQDLPTPIVGDDVTVTGVVQENFGLTRLNNVTDLVIESSGNDLPTAEILTTGTAGTEEFEGVLVQLDAVTCINDNLGFGEWLVTDGTGDYRVDDLFFDASPVQFSGYDLVGIAHFSFDNFKLLPRDATDVSNNADATSLGLSFDSGSSNVTESSGTVSFEVQIVNPAMMETTVEVAVTGGTAAIGTNYNFTDPTLLTFPANSTMSQSFDVEIVDDADPNDDRTIVLSLQNATNDATFATSELTINIDDDDTEITLTDIATVSEVDGQGVAINEGLEFTVGAIVLGVNLRPAGLQFSMVDQTGGMGVFSAAPLDDYVVLEGDSIIMTGTVSQFNGLTQMEPTSITLVSQGNTIPEPTVVTSLGEDTESQLVKLECVFIVDPSEWTGSGSGFNVTVSDGANQFDMRIDNDVDLYTQPAPVGSFELTGIGGQFDFAAPFDEGYQLLPRSSADIVANDCGIIVAPVNNDCAAATDIGDLLNGPVGEPQFSEQFTNAGATVADTDVPFGFECFGEDVPSLENNVWFSFEGDGNTYFLETNDCNGTATEYIPSGNTQIAVYFGFCGDFQIALSCNEDGPNANPDDLAAGIEIETEFGLTYLVMVDGFEGVEGDFCLSMTRSPLANDECEGAIDISDLVGGDLNDPQTSGVTSNLGGTSVNDPNPNDVVNDCWIGEPTLSSTVWYTFVGDGNEYFIETVNCNGVIDYIDDGDSQMAIFTGDCGDLTQVACNEDGPQGTGSEFPAGITLVTEAGVVYQVMVDGFEGADGEFCMQMTLTDILSTLNQSDFEFKAYPNPASDLVVIESPIALSNVSLINVLGQVVKEWNMSSAQRFEVATNDIESGVYLLQAQSEGKVSTLKLIIE
ncbi:MAG: T9SS type A sorting domain-containing protein [Flavobacteriales bacterium]|nr:T9SS type A sorting domain-containing protein [Flavobacteriales bacterium]